MPIVDLTPTDTNRIDAIAEILVASFADLAPDYLPTRDKALEEITDSFGDERISRVALTDAGEVAGWTAGAPLYGRLWELHPLVVAHAHRRSGYGRALVQDLARRVSARGGLTLQVSTSDETGRTNLFGCDLYDDPLARLRALKCTQEHPAEFYPRVGLSLVGVMPDAEGPGRPSIYFAMRV
jgi:aminoglycoside 6'-N-acetyltransferase I